MTFGQLSNKLLQTILRMSSNANHIVVVFDSYNCQVRFNRDLSLNWNREDDGI